MAALLLEICAGSIESAIAAQAGGADRIELCENLSAGGTTPSAGTFAVVRKQLQIPIFVLIRPRSGDFLYSEAEFEAMVRDIRLLKTAGADGFVTGVLSANGDVDIIRSSRLAEAASPLPCTFHRAFDLCRDPIRNLEKIMAAGYTRLLTSGQASSAVQGINLLNDLVNHAKNNLIVMPGGGITEENILTLKKETNATEFHASLRSPVQSRMLFQSTAVNMGTSGTNEFVWHETDADRVKKVKALLHNAS